MCYNRLYNKWQLFCRQGDKMYYHTLKTLYSFLGRDLIKNDNIRKIKEEIFSKLQTKTDFLQIISFLEETDDYEVIDCLLDMLAVVIFSKINIVYDHKTLKYGTESIGLKITISEIKEFIDILDYSDIESQNIFYLFSNDLQKRITGFKNILKREKKFAWREDEIKIYIKNLKPLSMDFLKLLTVYGEVDSDFIVSQLKLKNKKSVSALVSAITRNAPKDKEKFIFHEGDKITMNKEYRSFFATLIK